MTKRLFLTGAALLGVGGGAYWLWRQENPVRIIRGLPAGYHLVSAKDFKAWIDIAWFNGKRLQYPKRTVPAEIAENPGAAAFLTIDPLPHPLSSNPNPFDMRGWYLRAAKWTSADGVRTIVPTHRNSIPDGPGFAPLPYVYGDQPRKFTVEWRDLVDNARSGPMPITAPARLELELPPNHETAPELKTKTAHLAGLTLTFTPQKWQGPLFSPTYLLTATGGDPSTRVLLDFLDPTAILQSAICLQPGGEPAVICVDTKSAEMTIIANIVRPKNFQVTAKDNLATNRIDFKDDAGKLIAACTVTKMGSVWVEDSPHPFNTQIESYWTGRSYERIADPYNFAQVYNDFHPVPGRRYRATQYLPVKNVSSSIALGPEPEASLKK